MSSTIALHVRFNLGTFLGRPLKNKMKWPNSVFLRTWTTRRIFQGFLWIWTLPLLTSNGTRDSRDSEVKYKSIFLLDVVLSALPRRGKACAIQIGIGQLITNTYSVARWSVENSSCVCKHQRILCFLQQHPSIARCIFSFILGKSATIPVLTGLHWRRVKN